MATRGIIQHKNVPVIALVGRVNVGKSTLFNMLVEENKAIVSPIPGTTRTSNEAFAAWRGQYFRVIDTGGLTFEDSVMFEEDIIEQSMVALEKADIILFITDASEGILPQEIELAKRLRAIKDKPVIVVANKADSRKKEMNIYSGEWQKLGLGDPFAISAASGRNVGDLLDTIYDQLAEKISQLQDVAVIQDEQEKTIQISLIGKPNVGKSSLFNKIIGEEKVIVSDIAHTTREPHDTLIEFEYEQTDEEGNSITKKQKINFIDTAGIRRKAKVAGSLERQGIHKSIESIESSDIILLVLDGNETLSAQDMQLGGLLERRAKSVIILLNKWDLTEDNSDTNRNFVKKMIYSYFPHLDFAPIIFVSGKTGYRIHTIFEDIMHVWRARHTKVANRALEHFLEQTTKQHRPARGKGTRHPQLLGMRQLDVNPPVFEIFIKQKTSVHRSYINYLENRLRENFDFYGTPLIMRLKKVKR